MFLNLSLLTNICFSTLNENYGYGMISIHNFTLRNASILKEDDLLINNCNMLNITFYYNEPTDIKICLNEGSITFSNLVDCCCDFYDKDYKKIKTVDYKLIKDVFFGYIESENFDVTIMLKNKKLDCFLKTENEDDYDLLEIKPFFANNALKSFNVAHQLKFKNLENVYFKLQKTRSSFLFDIMNNSKKNSFDLFSFYKNKEFKKFEVPYTTKKNIVKFLIQNQFSENELVESTIKNELDENFTVKSNLPEKDVIIQLSFFN